MSNSIDRFYGLPDINFVEKDIETILADAIATYEQAYFEATGERKTLAQGDPIRIWIYTQALKLYGAYQLIDYTGKQNLLKYSSGDILENIGARVGVTRLDAKAAVVTQRFTLSAIQGSAVAIPQGTRTSPGNNIYFATKEYAEIPAGQLSVDVVSECTETGENGNGFITGQINVLVDPIAFVASTSNTDTSQGGADKESDESLRERIFLKPDSFSVAGPEDAYIYFTREANQSITDAVAYSPSPGVVDIRFILENGEIPEPAIISEVDSYLSAETRRPLTDNVIVAAPELVSYDITLTYYIKTSDANRAASIQTAVAAAIDAYKLWQKTKIGRDVNPDELLARIKAAGAKRAVIVAPVFNALTRTQIASEGTVTVTYGGLEDE